MIKSFNFTKIIKKNSYSEKNHKSFNIKISALKNLLKDVFVVV